MTRADAAFTGHTQPGHTDRRDASLLGLASDAITVDIVRVIPISQRTIVFRRRHQPERFAAQSARNDMPSVLERTPA
ncbi:MAG: hypothetical protein KIT24_05875 [Phycisphaeraceae bacterium]|nr:hypothetical protein [Phycisphaeraceae bacterium]